MNLIEELEKQIITESKYEDDYVLGFNKGIMAAVKIIKQIEGEEINEKLVYHPEHYNQEGKKECWEEMIEIYGRPATAIFDCLSAHKYKYRAGEKEGNSEAQDIAKIENYMNHADKMLGKKLKEYSVSERKALEIAIDTFVEAKKYLGGEKKC